MAYKRPQWRLKKKKQVKKKKVETPLSYDQLVESGYQFKPEPSAEEFAGYVIALDKLRSVVAQLVEEEQALVEAIFYLEMSEREYGASIGVPRTTVEYRRGKVLAKLRKMLDGEKW